MSDAALVLRVRGGDELAFRRLANRHADVLGGIVSRYFLPGGSVDDLNQEALCGLSEAIRDYSPAKGAFRGFVGLCAERKVQTAVITANRKKHSPLTSSLRMERPTRGPGDEEIGTLGDLLPAPAPTSDPSEVLAQRELLSSATEAVWSLTDMERAALLGVADGRSYAEIASAEDSSPKQIDNALQRARRKVAADLEPLVA